MPEAEDKAKAEKLAAAKKRVEQLKKQKGKKAVAKKAEEVENTSTESKLTGDAAPENSRTGEDEGNGDIPSQNKEEAKAADASSDTTRPSHNRQPSLSVQSKLRSSSFRKGSVSQAPLSPTSANLKSPNLPPLSPDGDTITEIYRKQALRIEELERDNRKLQKDFDDGESRWRKMEEEIEELREGQGDSEGLRGKAAEAEKEVQRLTTELQTLQRQNAHLLSNRPRHASSASVSASTSDLSAELASKSSTIESMELEISNLRAQISSSSSQSTQIRALTSKLTVAETAATDARAELTSLKKSQERNSNRAIKESSTLSTAQTRIATLERDLAAATAAATTMEQKATALERKNAALTTLHRESDARSQARSGESAKFEKEAAQLRSRLGLLENENGRLRDERERAKRRDAAGDGDGIDELEDEERKALERKVRGLEEELHELRSGAWRERRKELGDPDGPNSLNGRFDDVDLGPSPLKGSMSMGGITGVISGGLNALTGGAGGDALLDDDEEGFDDEEFARAQEEEAMRRVEMVKEIKRGLKEWEGWRIDLVEMRRAGGGGLAAGEIFDI